MGLPETSEYSGLDVKVNTKEEWVDSDATTSPEPEVLRTCSHLEDLGTTVHLVHDICNAERRIQLKKRLLFGPATATTSEVSPDSDHSNAEEPKTCPATPDCFPCTCLSCDMIICINTLHNPHPETSQSWQHFLDSGHKLGYCRFELYCFPCSKCFDLPEEVLSFFKTAMGRKRRAFSQIENASLRGIVNLGNTCFINAILQVLFHTPMIRQFFLKIRDSESPWEHRRSLRFKKDAFPKLEAKEQEGLPKCGLLTAFKDLLNEYYTSDTGSPILPTKLLCSVWENIEHLSGHRQQDAHEFFISLLYGLHMDLIEQRTAATTTTTTESDEPGKKGKKRKRSVSNAQSSIDKIFLGRLQSEVTCTVCRHSRYIFDPFWDSSLEITSVEVEPGKELQLVDLLQSFTKLEQLDRGNILQCPCCFRRTESTKQLSFKYLPQVICLHLKRFQQTILSPGSSSYQKIKTKVSFPEFLDFSPFKSDNVGGTKRFKERSGRNNNFNDKDDNLYTLYAIVSHAGSYSGGHYRTYIKQFGSWFKCDDNLIQLVRQEEVLQCEGYLLFYKKHHPGLPSYE